MRTIRAMSERKTLEALREPCPSAPLCRNLSPIYYLAEKRDPCKCLALYLEIRRRTGWRGFLRRLFGRQ